MTNAFYNHGSIPADNSQGSSAEIRAEFDSVQTGFDKLPTLSGNGDKVVVINTGATAMTVKVAGTMVGDAIVAASGKTTPVDADSVPLVDSAAANALKQLTWANLKAAMFSAWGALTAAGTDKATPTGADSLAITDSAAANATKKLTFTNLVAYLSGLCSAGWNAATATSVSGSLDNVTSTIISPTHVCGTPSLSIVNRFIVEYPGTHTIALPNAAIFAGAVISINSYSGAVVSAGANVRPLSGVSAGNSILSGSGKWARMVADLSGNWVIVESN
jgi:hypothetical protein